jgi:hypothetical protein
MQVYPNRRKSERERVAAAFRAASKEIEVLKRRWKAMPEDVRLVNPDLPRWFAEAQRPTDGSGHRLTDKRPLAGRAQSRTGTRLVQGSWPFA